MKFPWIDVWNSHIYLKAELDLSLHVCDRIYLSSFIHRRHLDLRCTCDSPCRETGAAGLNHCIFFLGEMDWAADMRVRLLVQVREPRKVPRLSLMFRFDQRVSLLLEGGT